MPTQRKRVPTRRGASPMRGDGGEYRGEYRGGGRGGSNLTTILVVLLIVGVLAFIFLIYSSQNKNNKPVAAPVVEQKAPVVQPPAQVKAPEPVVEEAPKKKPKEAPAPKKNINLEVTGEKRPEPAKEEPEVEVKRTTINGEEPVKPKSFMGGLSNPEMEKNQGNTSTNSTNPDQDRAREERRKKKDYELE